MGLWNLYFLTKLYLFHTGQMKPVWILNIALALLLVAPMESRPLRVIRQILAIGVGAALAWRESTLPPFERVISQFSNISEFTPAYLVELLQRLVSIQMVVAALLVLGVYLLVNRWLRTTTFVLIALLAMPFWYGLGIGTRGASAANVAGAADSPRADINATNNYDAILAAFRQQEASRSVTVAPLTASPDAQFDVILLHICSLSWDDLDAAKSLNHPLLSRFDYLFKNFSSAASYSGPAAIRVLRGACGQEEHKALYDPAPAECHIFADLAQAGFTPHVLMNHDGRFDNFRSIVEREMGVDGLHPEPTDGVPVAMRSFDNSPVLGDFDTFDHWYRQRLAQADKKPVALYYNTVTLHDGNRLPGKRLTSLESYPLRLKSLLDDVDRIIDTIAKSGRKAVVVFVPEHGAALRGDKNQISGLREIPTPNIIHVPVGVKLVGLPSSETPQPVTIDAPMSFLGLSQLVFNLVADSPFRQGAPALSQYAADLPQTQMVGENEATVTMKRTEGYVIHTPDGVWVEQK
ncbi:cellulose biosynthesis protein BcsG [Cupriavidus pauculus]|uniref:cellulose biosynthesis protein BcsG n=1 Tax=Cupriavidus pauculus TaxID=82633 RepID=UPI001FD6009F|nr:cellulose biosynthesis protein BcsG [Cupriavidus pauculus]